MPKKPRLIAFAGKTNRRTRSRRKIMMDIESRDAKGQSEIIIGTKRFSERFNAVLAHGKVAETPVPCQHVADYYTSRWKEGPNIAFNLLRLGYEEWSLGMVSPWNNLFGPRRLPFLKESLS